MTDHEQQSAPQRGKILDALTRAERATVTRPAPKSARAQMKFLLTRAKGSTKALAERLGVSRRTVERHRSGDITTPQKRLQAVLTEETESQWLPQVRAQARERAARGMWVECTAYFGFSWIEPKRHVETTDELTAQHTSRCLCALRPPCPAWA
jgi:hypothetical protein